MRIRSNPAVGATALLALLGLTACSQTPIVPTLDPVASPTSLPTQTITGWADPTTRVHIASAGGELVARPDSHSGRWVAEVTLSPDSENTLSITAERDGEASSAASAVIVHEAPRPESLTLTIDDPILDADTGSLSAVVTVGNDEPGVPLGGFEIAASVAGYSGVQDAVFTTNASGVARIELGGLTQSGTGELTVSVPANDALTDTVAFVVTGGDATALDLTLSAAGVETGDAIGDLQPETEVTANITITDGALNPIGPEVVIVTDAPGAVVAGNRIVGVQAAGTWRVAASVPGTTVADIATMTFVGGEPAEMVVTLSDDTTTAGEPVVATATVLDAYGNVVASSPGDGADRIGFTLAPSPAAPAGGVVDNTFTVESPVGRYEVVGTIDRDDSLGASAAVTFVPATPVAIELTLTGDSADGVIAAGDDVTYTYVATDAYGNVTPDPVSVTVTDPDALVIDNGLSGVGVISGLIHARALPFAIEARVAGTLVQADTEITVTPADGPRTVDVTLSTNALAIEESVSCFALVRDQYGNAIAAPAPTFSVALADGSDATGDYVPVGTDTFTMIEPGIYRFRASFDDGTNPVAIDDEYARVENIPDLTLPTVTIVAINGYGVCPDGTLKVGAPGACTDSEPDVTFTRGQTVSVEVEVDDDRGLAEASFTAFGTGVTFDDFALIGAGEHVPGEPLTVAFAFNVGNNAVPGDASVVAQAIDLSGNSQNSTRALMRIDLGIEARDGRELTTVAGGPLFNTAYDVAQSPIDGAIYVSRRDTADPSVIRVDGSLISTFATFDARPEYIEFDADGNLYVSIDGFDQIEQVSPAGDVVTYVDQGDPNSPNDPEGLSVLGTPRRASGRVTFSGTISDGDCVEIDGVTFEFDTSGSCGNCNGSGTDQCVSTSGSSSDVVTRLAAAVNGASTGDVLLATTAQQCAGTGNPCVALVAATPGDVGTINVTERRDNQGRMSVSSVSGGQDDPTLVVGDRGSNSALGYAIPTSLGSAPYDTWDSGGAQPRGVLAIERFDGTGERLFVFATDDNGQDLIGFDDVAARQYTINMPGGTFDTLFDLLLADDDCLLVSSRDTGEILAVTGIDAGDSPSVDVIADGLRSPRGLGWETTPTGRNLLVADDSFDLVVRIAPSPAVDDCF